MQLCFSLTDHLSLPPRPEPILTATPLPCWLLQLFSPCSRPEPLRKYTMTSVPRRARELPCVLRLRGTAMMVCTARSARQVNERSMMSGV